MAIVWQTLFHEFFKTKTSKVLCTPFPIFCCVGKARMNLVKKVVKDGEKEKLMKNNSIFFQNCSDLLWEKNVLETKTYFWKEYLSNLLERWLLCQIVVFWVRKVKFWLLAFFFKFSLTVQSFRKIGQHLYWTFYKGPHFDVSCFCNLPKIKCLISMLSNLAETLHS